jgi:hypothetical protein
MLRGLGGVFFDRFMAISHLLYCGIIPQFFGYVHS